ncbi:TPA: hypothetical protein OBR09_004144 [Escherichia coli]|nr:hypothetical protein [Escherichia coli]
MEIKPEDELSNIVLFPVFEVDDDATPDEIHDEAKEIFFNYCNYSYHEIKDEEEEQNG